MVAVFETVRVRIRHILEKIEEEQEKNDKDYLRLNISRKERQNGRCQSMG